MEFFSAISLVNIIVSCHMCKSTAAAIPFTSFFNCLDDIFESNYFQKVLSKELIETFTKNRLFNQDSGLG